MKKCLAVFITMTIFIFSGISFSGTAMWPCPKVVKNGNIDIPGYVISEIQIIPIAANTVLTVAQCKNTIVIITGAYTVTLPDVSGFTGSNGGNVLIYSTGADTVHVDVFASDRTVLNGDPLDDGDKITSPGTAGAFIGLVNDAATGWRTLGRYGAWTDGG